MNNTNKTSQEHKNGWFITRRFFLKVSALTTAGICTGLSPTKANFSKSIVKYRFGIVTDSHYADKINSDGKYYRESLSKMKECVTLMNKEKVDFLIELGDLKDISQPVSEIITLMDLDAIEKVFKQFNGPRYHVLGNHDMDCISKEQFLAHIENTGIPKGKKFYSFERNGLHFIVLDANYTSGGMDYERGNFEWADTNIPQKEIDWLKKDILSSEKPVIAFTHQLLDGNLGPSNINNAKKVRQIFENSGKVLAVFQGHMHKGRYRKINKIHYYTLKAMVSGEGKENNSYAIVNVYDDHINVTGYRKAVDKSIHINNLNN